MNSIFFCQQKLLFYLRCSKLQTQMMRESDFALHIFRRRFCFECVSLVPDFQVSVTLTDCQLRHGTKYQLVTYIEDRHATLGAKIPVGSKFLVFGRGDTYCLSHGPKGMMVVMLISFDAIHPFFQVADSLCIECF